MIELDLLIMDSSADTTNTGILCEKGEYRVRYDILWKW